MNPNTSKWIQRAILKHFTTQLSPDKVIAETQDIDKNTFEKWYEVRVDIKYRQLQRSQYHAFVNIDLLMIAAKQPNIYHGKSMTGKAAAAFIDIPVMNDSADHVFCLRLDGDIIDTYYGELESQANMEQATVEGTYEAYIVE